MIELNRDDLKVVSGGTDDEDFGCYCCNIDEDEEVCEKAYIQGAGCTPCCGLSGYIELNGTYHHVKTYGKCICNGTASTNVGDFNDKGEYVIEPIIKYC